MRNHLGQFECRLCLSLHINTGSYLAHTQGKRHQQNLAKRAARENLDKVTNPVLKPRIAIPKKHKIGRPGYRITKQFDKGSKQRSLLFQLNFSEIEDGSIPRQRFMSAFEQRKEPTDRKYQYVLFHADPYEVIAFKVPSYEIDRNSARTNTTILSNIVNTSESEKKKFAY